MPPTKYRKKPIEITAVEWTGDNEAELIEFTGHRFEAVPQGERAESPDITAEVFDYLHGSWVGVYTGHWVIRGVLGEFYPIDKDVLAATYDVVEAAPTA